MLSLLVSSLLGGWSLILPENGYLGGSGFVEAPCITGLLQETRDHRN